MRLTQWRLLLCIPILLLLNGGCILINVDVERTIHFSGYQWTVKNGFLAPGPNHFSDSPSNVYVDSDGALHLKIEQRNSRWYSSEVISEKSFGYGRYLFHIDGPIDQLDPQAVLGLFTWDTAPEENNREIDIEFSRWGKDNGSAANGQYVVQPYDLDANKNEFNFSLSEDPEGIYTTHVVEWRADKIVFASYYGHYSLAELDTAASGEESSGGGAAPLPLTDQWSYTGDVPNPGNAQVRMNLWLFNGEATANTSEQELSIKRFSFSSDE